jgi:hypothetical protein
MIIKGNGKAEGSLHFDFEEIAVEAGEGEVYCSGSATVYYVIVRYMGSETEPPYYEEDLDIKLDKDTIVCVDENGIEIVVAENIEEDIMDKLYSGNTATNAIKKYMEDMECDSAEYKHREKENILDYDAWSIA